MMMAMLLVTVNVYAGVASQPKNEQEKSGIVTPDIAIGVYRTDKFNYDESMNIVICMQDYQYDYYKKTCTDMQGKNKWKFITQVPPKAKTYVGFKSISQGSSHVIEIYWK